MSSTLSALKTAKYGQEDEDRSRSELMLGNHTNTGISQCGSFTSPHNLQLTVWSEPALYHCMMNPQIDQKLIDTNISCPFHQSPSKRSPSGEKTTRAGLEPAEAHTLKMFRPSSSLGETGVIFLGCRTQSKRANKICSHMSLASLWLTPQKVRLVREAREGMSYLSRERQVEIYSKYCFVSLGAEEGTVVDVFNPRFPMVRDIYAIAKVEHLKSRLRSRFTNWIQDFVSTYPDTEPRTVEDFILGLQTTRG